MFEIEFLPEKQVVRWRMQGFWTEAVAHEFKQAISSSLAKARKDWPRFYCLCDTRGFPVQSDPVMRMFAAQARAPMAEGSRKLAILVGTTLNQLQAQRSFGSSDRIRVFRNEDEAFAWFAERPTESRAAAVG